LQLTTKVLRMIDCNIVCSLEQENPSKLYVHTRSKKFSKKFKGFKDGLSYLTS